MNRNQKFKNVSSIAVFRALVVGDMLCSIPAFRALRSAFPEARITLIGLPWARSLLGFYPEYFDDFIPFPGYPGMPECESNVEAFPEFIAECQRQRFDLAVQMHGSGRLTNAIALLMNARMTCGFYPEGEFCPDPSLFMPWPEIGHEIHKCLGLMEFLGAPSQGDSLEFPVSHETTGLFFSRPDTAALSGRPYVCLHPGARFPSRRWPSEKFAETADALHEKGFEIVLTGTAAEAELTAAVKREMRAPALDLSGRTSLKELASLLAEAELLITNDTGISHLASAVCAPSIVLVMGSDPDRWAPLDRRRHRALFHAVACRPCMHIDCPIGFPCAGITPEEVLDAAARLIADVHTTDEKISYFPGTLHRGARVCGR